MSALVGYASSDDDDEVLPEKPAKSPKLDASELETANEKSGAHTRIVSRDEVQEPASAPFASITDAAEADQDTARPVEGPALGPAAPPAVDDVVVNAAETPSEPPLSSYTFERQRLRELTMPTVPNFDIPESPPPYPANGEEAATLAATTKKFERFLELKKQGVHFNERLRNSSSLRNPSLLPKLMDFAGISTEDSYRSSLPDDLAVPVKWPEECYAENLIKQNDRREKKRLAERDRLDFVPASKSAELNAKTGTSVSGSESGHRKSRFDKR